MVHETIRRLEGLIRELETNNVLLQAECERLRQTLERMNGYAATLLANGLKGFVVVERVGRAGRMVCCASGAYVTAEDPCKWLVLIDATNGQPIWLVKGCPDAIEELLDGVKGLLVEGRIEVLTVMEDTVRRDDCTKCKEQWRRRVLGEGGSEGDGTTA